MVKVEKERHQKWAKDLKKGNKDAFSSLFNEFKQDIYFFAYTYFRDKETSEELVQDVFVRLWEKRELINPSLCIHGYIFKIAKNLILDSLRKRNFEIEYAKEVQFNFSGVHENTENEAIYSDYLALVKEATNKLPPKRKRIFQLSREKNMSYADISQHLGISINVVENQMSKALKHMRQYLRANSDIAV